MDYKSIGAHRNTVGIAGLLKHFDDSVINVMSLVYLRIWLHKLSESCPFMRWNEECWSSGFKGLSTPQRQKKHPLGQITVRITTHRGTHKWDVSRTVNRIEFGGFPWSHLQHSPNTSRELMEEVVIHCRIFRERNTLSLWFFNCRFHSDCADVNHWPTEPELDWRESLRNRIFSEFEDVGRSFTRCDLSECVVDFFERFIISTIQVNSMYAKRMKMRQMYIITTTSIVCILLTSYIHSQPRQYSSMIRSCWKWTSSNCLPHEHRSCVKFVV